MEPDSFKERKDFVIRVCKAIRPVDVAVVLFSLIALYLFRLEDGFQLIPIWQLQQSELKHHSIQVQPLIADLDGNGLKEIVISSEDRIEIFSFHSDEFDDEPGLHDENILDDEDSPVLYHLHKKAEFLFNEIKKNTSVVYPVAMSSGCISKESHACNQVVVIVWNDWSVTLLSNQLKVIWHSQLMNVDLHQNLQITEMAVLIATGNKSTVDHSSYVVVGGMIHLKNHASNSVNEHHHHHGSQIIPNKTAEEISRDQAGVDPGVGDNTYHEINSDLAKYIGHFTTYGLNAKSGAILWKHEPGDFEANQKPDKEPQSSHFKLQLKKKSKHRGEVHWQKYSASFLDHLPFSWCNPYYDTSITLAEFTRTTVASKKERKATITVSERLINFVKDEKYEKNVEMKHWNSVLIKHSKGMEVLDINYGNPLSSLPLESVYSSLGDVNDDGNIELIKFHEQHENLKHDCFLIASDLHVKSLVLFNSSVCYPSNMMDFFADESSSPIQENLRSLPPLLTPSLQRSSGILHHLLGHGLSRHHPVGMDTVVLTSSGKLTAFEPSGRFLWQVDTEVTWSNHESSLPSMTTISLSSDDTKDGVIILGSRELIAVSLLDGAILSVHSLPCVPTHPLVLGDINNDISDEFLVRCRDRYIAFSLQRHSRTWLTLLLYSGIGSIVCITLFIIKFFEREEFPFDTIDYLFKALRFFPVQGTKF